MEEEDLQPDSPPGFVEEIDSSELEYIEVHTDTHRELPFMQLICRKFVKRIEFLSVLITVQTHILIVSRNQT